MIGLLVLDFGGDSQVVILTVEYDGKSVKLLVFEVLGKRLKEERWQSGGTESAEHISLVNTSWHWGGVEPKWFRWAVLVAGGLYLILMILQDWHLWGMNRFWYFMSGGSLFVGGLLVYKLGRRQLRRGGGPSVDFAETTTNSRLVCHGDVMELARIRELNGEAAEPFIIRLLIPQSMRQCWAVGISVALVVFVVLVFADPPHGEMLPWLSAFPGIWLYAAIRPRYYRVSRGRFEVLAFTVFGLKCRVIESVDLTRTQVVCRYNKSTLYFKFGEDDKKREVEIPLVPLWFDRHEFVEAVFQAALCREPGPTLPEDRLLG